MIVADGWLARSSDITIEEDFESGRLVVRVLVVGAAAFVPINGI